MLTLTMLLAPAMAGTPDTAAYGTLDADRLERRQAIVDAREQAVEVQRITIRGHRDMVRAARADARQAKHFRHAALDELQTDASAEEDLAQVRQASDAARTHLEAADFLDLRKAQLDAARVELDLRRAELRVSEAELALSEAQVLDESRLWRRHWNPVARHQDRVERRQRTAALAQARFQVATAEVEAYQQDHDEAFADIAWAGLNVSEDQADYTDLTERFPTDEDTWSAEAPTWSAASEPMTVW